MIKTFDLSQHKLISFEIGTSCNLKNIHLECPINKIKREPGRKTLTPDIICTAMDQAKELNFNGHFAFHHYNEPLLYIEKIQEVIEKRPDYKYLLWTNGMLLQDIEKKGFSLSMFDKVVITCYNMENMKYFEEIKEKHPDVTIGIADMDERLNIYNSTFQNEFSCKKPLVEMPIDHYGEIALCTHDWNNTCKIGNIINEYLKEIVMGEHYQNILNITRKLGISKNCEEVCRHCAYAYITLKLDKTLI